MKLSKGLLQSYAAQQFSFDALMAFKEALTKNGKLSLTREDSVAIRNLMSAWESAQIRVAFHRRVPSPGVLKRDPEPKPKRHSTSGFRPMELAVPSEER